jgi:acyl-coenzyme A thioesterase PaaI-like protein
MEPHSLVAFNTATASANKIHDDEVARRFGFRGGLVPGVDVYAYLCHPPAVAWGLEWLQRGTMRARFHQPVYDGHRVEVTPGDGGRLELRDDGGELCAEGVATLPEAAAPTPDPDDWPDVEQVADPPPASPEVLVPGTAFGLAAHGFRAARHGEYLADVRETAGIYAAEGVAHPGWVLRDANYVLSTNVRLGPWIHVESVVQHHGVVRDGEEVTARALVTREWDHKGHRFVELDVLHLADLRPVARTTHTAIYRPRGSGA